MTWELCRIKESCQKWWVFAWYIVKPVYIDLCVDQEKPIDDLDMLEELELTGPDAVPLCLLSRVKEIEITRLGRVDEEEMLKYLLDNAKVLDKFTVNSRMYIKDGILQ